jgi:PPE-repeat protein
LTASSKFQPCTGNPDPITATPSARIELARAEDVDPTTVNGATFGRGSTGIPFGNGGSSTGNSAFGNTGSNTGTSSFGNGSGTTGSSGFGNAGSGSSGFGNDGSGSSRFGNAGGGDSNHGNSGTGNSNFGNSGNGNSTFGNTGTGTNTYVTSEDPWQVLYSNGSKQIDSSQWLKVSTDTADSQGKSLHLAASTYDLGFGNSLKQHAIYFTDPTLITPAVLLGVPPL